MEARMPLVTHRLTASALLLLSVLACGCGKSTPPASDPASAPWLLDPQSQIKGLKDSDYRVRGLAAFNLGNMGSKAAEAAPLLEKLARDDPQEKVRENAREALEKIRGASN